MNPGSVSGRVGEQMPRQNSGEAEAERGYCSGETGAGEMSSHFQDFVAARSYAVGCPCDRPWLVERQAGEMTGPESRGLNSAAFQKSRSVDPERSGNAWHRAERGDLAGSFDH
jgi:hypothetical protein